MIPRASWVYFLYKLIYDTNYIANFVANNCQARQNQKILIARYVAKIPV